MSVNVKKKHLRNLNKIPFRINKVYSAYRSGGLEVAGKYVGKTFKYFPKRLTDEVVVGGDERAKLQEGDAGNMELRLQIWNKDERRFEFHKVKEKLDGTFFKTYGKVFDIEVVIGGPVTIPAWNGTAEVDTEFGIGETLLLKEVSAGKLKTLLNDLELDEDVELVDGKDKMGNPAKVKPFDYEDSIKDKLEGVYVVMKVDGVGMDSKYKFKLAPEFEISPKTGEIDVDDESFPF